MPKKYRIIQLECYYDGNSHCIDLEPEDLPLNISTLVRSRTVYKSAIVLRPANEGEKQK